MTRLGIRNSNNGLIRLKNKKLIFIINIKNDYYFVISRFSRNDKPDENIIMKMIALAPIEVERLKRIASPVRTFRLGCGISS